jgi:hypothetical protein
MKQRYRGHTKKEKDGLRKKMQNKLFPLKFNGFLN